MKRLTDPAQGYCETYCPDGIAPGCDPEKCDRKADVAMYEALKCYEFSDAAILNRAAQIIGTTVDHLLEEKFHNSLIGKTVYGIRVRIVRHIGRNVKKRDYFVVDEKILHQWTKDCYVAEKVCTRSDIARLGKTVFLTQEDAEAAIGGVDHA